MLTENAHRKISCCHSPFIFILVFLFLCFWQASARGAGFQIPNQSLRAIGIAGATVAHTPGAEAAFYNPANMSFGEEEHQLELSVTTLALPEIEYTDRRSPLLSGTSESELFLLPLLHYTTRPYGDFRFGFSLTYPYGLTKEWQQPFPAATAEKFSLLIVEANPSASYLLTDRLSVAGGVRFVYADGEVRNRVNNPPFGEISPLGSVGREIDSATDFNVGYNLALTFRPSEAWSLAATYKSEVDLELDGDGLLQAVAGGFPITQYDGPANLPLSLPALLSIAASYSFSDVTIELTWNRTFWSAIEELDFAYSQSFLGSVFDPFDRPVPKNWEDSDAFRLGITYRMNQSFTATAGIALDETPVPEETLGFELPDADSLMYCAGVQYTVSEQLRMGISYMYQHNRSRSVTTVPVGGLPAIEGKFTDGGAHAINVGLILSF